MTPVDRVGADAALAVVDDRALVVGAQQDEGAEELQEIRLVEPGDLAVRLALAVADHAPQPGLGGKNLRHCRGESTSGPPEAALPCRVGPLYEWRKTVLARRALVSLGLVALGGCVLALAFTGPDSGQAHPNAPGTGTFRVAFFVNPGGIESIDPALGGSAWRERLLRPACAQLMAFPGPKPELAVGYPRISNGRRTYTFTIRRGVVFNNGRALTARNFARAFERALHPDMDLVPISSSPSSSSGVAPTTSAGRPRSAASSPAANTLQIRLTKAVPTFLEEIAARPYLRRSGQPPDRPGRRAGAPREPGPVLRVALPPRAGGRPHQEPALSRRTPATRRQPTSSTSPTPRRRRSTRS